MPTSARTSSWVFDDSFGYQVTMMGLVFFCSAAGTDAAGTDAAGMLPGALVLPWLPDAGELLDVPDPLPPPQAIKPAIMSIVTMIAAIGLIISSFRIFSPYPFLFSS